MRITFDRWPMNKVGTYSNTDRLNRGENARFGWGLVRGYGNDMFKEFGRFGGGVDYSFGAEISLSRKSIILYAIIGLIHISWGSSENND